jgi:lipoate-protein ligase A
MAVDEAILEASVRGDVPPTLRLYAWEPPCLSLGYAQASNDADLPRLSALGWQLVRRPTGGKAILHTDELTYSVAGPADEARLSGGVLDSYRRLSQALLLALSFLGASAAAHPQAGSVPDSDVKGPVCFEVPSNYEITANGKKLIGSAQSRRLGGVLQHGSLPLFGDLGRITQALTFSNDASRQRAQERLFQRATTLQQVLGDAPAWQEAAQAFVQGFEAALSLDLHAAPLTAAERERADQLVREKYGNPAWTDRLGSIETQG